MWSEAWFLSDSVGKYISSKLNLVTLVNSTMKQHNSCALTHSPQFGVFLQQWSVLRSSCTEWLLNLNLEQRLVSKDLFLVLLGKVIEMKSSHQHYWVNLFPGLGPDLSIGAQSLLSLLFVCTVVVICSRASVSGLRSSYEMVFLGLISVLWLCWLRPLSVSASGAGFGFDQVQFAWGYSFVLVFSCAVWLASLLSLPKHPYFKYSKYVDLCSDIWTEMRLSMGVCNVEVSWACLDSVLI